MIIPMKTYQTKILEDFDLIFSEYQGVPIAIYGTGEYSRLLLTSDLMERYQVSGIIDDNFDEKVFLGYPVIKSEDISTLCSTVIIIVASLSVGPVIYQRIRSKYSFCDQLSIFYMNGERADEEPDIPDFSGLRVDTEELFYKSEKYDVISFDLFDTLVERKCVFPPDIFSLVSDDMKRSGVLLTTFAGDRRDAESFVYHNRTKYVTLDMIYEHLSSKRIYRNRIDELKALELRIERENIYPRAGMLELLFKLQKRGKTVVLTSDMYLSDAQLSFVTNGITDRFPRLISCEKKASKHDGKLYEMLREQFPKKPILHIGDNETDDVQEPVKHGIDSVWIPSGRKLAERFRITDCISNRKRRELFVSECFSSPFCVQEDNRILINNPEQFGYLFYGPLALTYAYWILRKTQEEKVETLLLLARDGYIFRKIIDAVNSREHVYPELKTVYFLGSRKSLGIASIKTDADIEFFIEEMCGVNSVSIKWILQELLLVTPDGGVVEEKTLRDVGKEKLKQYLKEHYRKKIFESAEKARRNYYVYIDSLQLSSGNLGLMNFVGRGISQHCLSRILGRPLSGLYVMNEYDVEDILPNDCYFSMYPEKVSTHTTRTKLGINYLLGEIVFSAPTGSVSGFDALGRPIYEECDDIQRNFVNQCHAGILRYVEDALQIGISGAISNDDINDVDLIFGMQKNPAFFYADSINKGMRFTDTFDQKNGKEGKQII